MKRFITIFAFCFCLSVVNIFAQKPIKFTSLYTNLNKDCKTLKGGEGQDDAFDCKGIGGYRIYNWSAAAAQFFAVTAQKSEEDRFLLATQNFDFDMRKIKVEWRLANGKPFAVIMRFNKYTDAKDESSYFGKKIGEELIVKGLKGFERIDFTVDGKTPNANIQARKLADNAFLQK